MLSQQILRKKAISITKRKIAFKRHVFYAKKGALIFFQEGK